MKTKKPQEANINKKVITSSVGVAVIEDGKFTYWGDRQTYAFLDADKMNDDYIDQWLSFLLTIKFALEG